MIAQREGEEEDDQDEQVVVFAFAQVVAPAEDQPGQQGDGHEADRVDLLVDDRLVPHGEGGCRDQGRGSSAQEAEALVVGEEGHHPVDDEEPECGGHAAVRRREEVDLHCGRKRQRREQQFPSAGQQDEDGVPGRVWDANDMGGGDVLARVPERRGRRQRDHVEQEDRESGDARVAVGRCVAC